MLFLGRPGVSEHPRSGYSTWHRLPENTLLQLDTLLLCKLRSLMRRGSVCVCVCVCVWVCVCVISSTQSYSSFSYRLQQRASCKRTQDTTHRAQYCALICSLDASKTTAQTVCRYELTDSTENQILTPSRHGSINIFNIWSRCVTRLLCSERPENLLVCASYTFSVFILQAFWNVMFKYANEALFN